MPSIIQVATNPAATAPATRNRSADASLTPCGIMITRPACQSRFAARPSCKSDARAGRPAQAKQSSVSAWVSAAYLEVLIVLTTFVTPETWRATSLALSAVRELVTVPIK